MRSESEKKRIVAAYRKAPYGQKKLVLEKYGVSQSMISYWIMLLEEDDGTAA